MNNRFNLRDIPLRRKELRTMVQTYRILRERQIKLPLRGKKRLSKTQKETYAKL